MKQWVIGITACLLGLLIEPIGACASETGPKPAHLPCPNLAQVRQVEFEATAEKYLGQGFVAYPDDVYDFNNTGWFVTLSGLSSSSLEMVRESMQEIDIKNSAMSQTEYVFSLPVQACVYRSSLDSKLKLVAVPFYNTIDLF